MLVYQRVISCHGGKTMSSTTSFGNGKHTTCKNGDDLGMLYGIVLST
jgi:hypothetical protein